MKNLTATLLLVALIAVPSQAQDGPFGLNMGADPTDYGCSADDNSDFLYRCNEVPKPHPSIQRYVVWSYPETGIAFIKVWGRVNENDKYGSRVRSQMEEIAEQISTKYGTWTEFDDYMSSSGIWTDADEWSRSIEHDERFYSYQWEFESNEQVDNIYLYAIGLRDETAFGIDFALSNIDRFDAIKKSRGADAF